MEKQIGFCPDLLPNLFQCAIFALFQPFFWQKDFTCAILI